MVRGSYKSASVLLGNWARAVKMACAFSAMSVSWAGVGVIFINQHRLINKKKSQIADIFLLTVHTCRCIVTMKRKNGEERSSIVWVTLVTAKVYSSNLAPLMPLLSDDSSWQWWRDLGTAPMASLVLVVKGGSQHPSPSFLFSRWPVAFRCRRTERILL